MTRHQRTLLKTVSFSGIGLHTGAEVTLRFCPSDEQSGIVFQRVDLPGKPLVPVTVSAVQSTARATKIGVGDAHVHTVEHVLAALKAYNIDNLRIEMMGPEPPTGDGSSLPYVSMIEEAGVKEQSASIAIRSLKKPAFFSDGSVHLVAVPADEYRISYTLHYPHVPAIRSQYFSVLVTEQTFKQEVAPCRTFSIYDEVRMLMERGLIKGGSLENSVVIDKDVVFSKEGLRFPDEMARHKVLDLIGDLSLVGVPFKAHVMAICSGHTSNVAFAAKLYENLMGE